jgi:hypothetical protein
MIATADMPLPLVIGLAIVGLVVAWLVLTNQKRS